MSDPLAHDNNLHGTMVLLQAMVAHGVDKIVFSSTAATYGEPERVPILETDKTVPTNCYGETKLAMEKMMSWTSRAHGLSVWPAVLQRLRRPPLRRHRRGPRPGDPSDPPDPPGAQRPAGEDLHLRRRLRHQGRYLRPGSHPRSDLAQAHILALDHYLLQGGESDAFNLGNGVGFTVKEVIDVARAVTGHPIPAETCPAGPATLLSSSPLQEGGGTAGLETQAQ